MLLVYRYFKKLGNNNKLNITRSKTMKKIVAIFCACAMLIGFAHVSSSFAKDKTMTNAEFAELVIGVIGINLPAGSNMLADNEYFEVMGNVLALNGIYNFVAADPNAHVACNEFVDVLYTMVGAEGDLSESEKLEYLINNCNMPAYGLGELITLAEATEIINNPACSVLVAEAYREPGAVAAIAGGDRSDTEAPGFKLEETPPGTTPPTLASGA